MAQRDFNGGRTTPESPVTFLAIGSNQQWMSVKGSTIALKAVIGGFPPVSRNARGLPWAQRSNLTLGEIVMLNGRGELTDQSSQEGGTQDVVEKPGPGSLPQERGGRAYQVAQHQWNHPVWVKTDHKTHKKNPLKSLLKRKICAHRPGKVCGERKHGWGESAFKGCLACVHRGWCSYVIHRWWSSCMYTRAYIAVSYVGDAIMPCEGHEGP